MCSLLKFDVWWCAHKQEMEAKNLADLSEKRTSSPYNTRVNHAVPTQRICVYYVHEMNCVLWIGCMWNEEARAKIASGAAVAVAAIAAAVTAAAAAARKYASFLSLFTHDNRFSLLFCVLCADCCVICMWQNGIFCNPHFIHYMLLLWLLSRLDFGVIVFFLVFFFFLFLFTWNLYFILLCTLKIMNLRCCFLLTLPILVNNLCWMRAV